MGTICEMGTEGNCDIYFKLVFPYYNFKYFSLAEARGNMEDGWGTRTGGEEVVAVGVEEEGEEAKVEVEEARAL